MSDTARDQALAQISSIVAMVAALNCNYERLQELKDEREALTDYLSDCEEAYKFHDSDDTKSTPEWEDLKKARAELAEWDEANAQELADLEEAAGDNSDADEAREAIEQDPLSVEVREGWHFPGDSGTVDEFRVVLCTGGPHVELVGDLDRGQPTRVRVLYRDWGDSGELFEFDHEAVLEYLAALYFGE